MVHLLCRTASFSTVHGGVLVHYLSQVNTPRSKPGQTRPHTVLAAAGSFKEGEQEKGGTNTGGE